MFYVESKKSFKVRREKKLIYLPSAKKTLGKIMALGIPNSLPSAEKRETHGKKPQRGHPSVSVPAIRSFSSVR